MDGGFTTSVIYAVRTLCVCVHKLEMGLDEA